MIEARALTKRYGDKTAVHDLSFTVLPGIVTGFLGPNGAGKSTTMRMILGLDAPTSGRVTVNGLSYWRITRRPKISSRKKWPARPSSVPKISGGRIARWRAGSKATT